MSAMRRLGLSYPATSGHENQLRMRPHEVWRSVAGEATQQSAELSTILDAHGMAREAARQCCEDGLTQMQTRLISTPADLKATDWAFLSEAFKVARHRWLALRLWLRVTAKNARQLGARWRNTSLAELNSQNSVYLADVLAGKPSEGGSIRRTQKGGAEKLVLVTS